MGDALHVNGGVTDAREARLAQGGLLTLQGPGALDVRTGVLAGPGATALLTGTSDTGPMTVAIGPHVLVGSRGSANGPYLGPVLEAQTKVSIAAAPASGSRIDVVYAKQQDATSGIPSPDVTTAPLYSVLQGAASTTPTKPDLSTVVGAVEVGTVTVAAGATSTNGSGVTIANTAQLTVARGGILPVTASDATAGTYVDQYRGHPTNGLERWDGQRWSTPTPLNAWVNDVFSYGGNANPYNAPFPTTYSNLPGMSGSSVAVPPGRTLEVELSVSAVQLNASTNAFLQVYVGPATGTNVQDGAFYSTGGAQGAIMPCQLAGAWTNTGSSTATGAFSIAAQATSGSGTVQTSAYGVVRLRHRVL